MKITSMFRLYLIIILVASIAYGTLYSLFDIVKVRADLIIETSTFYVNSSNGTNTVAESQNDVDWSDLRNGNGDVLISHCACYYDSGGNSEKWDGLSRGIAQWDTSSLGLTDLDDVVSITVRGYISENTQTFALPMRFALYSQIYEPANGWYQPIVAGDFDIMGIGGIQMCEYEYQDDYGTSEWVDMEILDDRWEELFPAGDYDVAVVALRASADRSGFAPTWEEDETCRIKFYATSYPMQLVIEYWATPPDRDMDKPAPGVVDNTTTGFETADNITWLSPRCAYNDESLIVQVAGESGADLTFNVVDENGTLLVDEYENAIWTNGTYDYEFSVDDDYTGLIRVVELNNNIASTWGYVSEIDNSQTMGQVSADYTEYPQYYIDFDEFAHYNGDVFAIHWKTGLSTDNFSECSVRGWYLGDSSDEVYNETLDDLVDNYWEVGYESNEEHCAWRYALFAFNDSIANWNDRDDLFISLDQDYGADTSGWYQFLLYDDTASSEITTTVSCPWFVQDADDDGIIISLDSLNYGSGETVEVAIYVGDRCQVLDSLADIDIHTYVESGDIFDTTSDTLDDNNSIYEVTAPLSGDGSIAVVLSDGSVSFEYEYRIDISSSGGGVAPPGDPGGLVKQMMDWIGGLGLGEGGGYLVTIVAMVLAFALLYSSSVLRVAVPLLILTVALAIGWVDPWVYIPLAIGLGFVIWSVFRKRASGSPGE